MDLKTNESFFNHQNLSKEFGQDGMKALKRKIVWKYSKENETHLKICHVWREVLSKLFGHFMKAFIK